MNRRFFLVLAVMLAAALSACEREGPMEKAGRNVDEAGKDLREAVKGKK